MSRADTGWEYGRWGVRWAPTTATAISTLTYDKYGQEYEELHADLMHIVRAAQRDAEDTLREWARSFPDTPTGRSIAATVDEGADKIAPTYPEED
ncbi:hypothetical protein [Streptomyces sp. NPDC051546]|uniref:hypothetical protein n=1 Tax=Streptomyces sp. NPDC051546 TaxID=3365655 RepID=UPI0037B16980